MPQPPPDQPPNITEQQSSTSSSSYRPTNPPTTPQPIARLTAKWYTVSPGSAHGPAYNRQPIIPIETLPGMLLCRALESGEKTLQDPPGTVHEFTDWQQQLVHLGQRIEFGCLPEGGVKDHMAEQEQLYTKWLGLFREEMMKREREALAKKHELEKSKLAEESARNAKKWRLEERGRMEEEEERESRKLRWEFLGL